MLQVLQWLLPSGAQLCALPQGCLPALGWLRLRHLYVDDSAPCFHLHITNIAENNVLSAYCLIACVLLAATVWCAPTTRSPLHRGGGCRPQEAYQHECLGHRCGLPPNHVRLPPALPCCLSMWMNAWALFCLLPAAIYVAPPILVLAWSR